MPNSFGDAFAAQVFIAQQNFIDTEDTTMVAFYVKDDLLPKFPFHINTMQERKRLYNLIIALVGLLEECKRDGTPSSDAMAQIIQSENNAKATTFNLNFSLINKMPPSVMPQILMYAKISKFIFHGLHSPEVKQDLRKWVECILSNPCITEVECDDKETFATLCAMMNETVESSTDFAILPNSIKRMRKPIPQENNSQSMRLQSASSSSHTGSKSDDDNDDVADVLLEIFAEDEFSQEDLPQLLQMAFETSATPPPSQIDTQRIINLFESLEEAMPNISDNLVYSIVSCENARRNPVVHLNLTDLISIKPKLKSHLVEIFECSRASILHLHAGNEQSIQQMHKESSDSAMLLIIQLLGETSLSAFKIIDPAIILPQKYFSLLACAIIGNLKLVDITPLPEDDDIKCLLIRNQLIQAVRSESHTELKNRLNNINNQHAILLALAVILRKNIPKTTINIVLSYLKPQKALLSNLENRERRILLNNELCVKKLVTLLTPFEIKALSHPLMTAYFELTRYATKVHRAAVNSVNHNDYVLGLLQDPNLSVSQLALKLVVRCKNTRKHSPELSRITELFQPYLPNNPNLQPSTHDAPESQYDDAESSLSASTNSGPVFSLPSLRTEARSF